MIEISLNKNKSANIMNPEVLLLLMELSEIAGLKLYTDVGSLYLDDLGVVVVSTNYCT